MDLRACAPTVRIARAMTCAQTGPMTTREHGGQTDDDGPAGVCWCCGCSGTDKRMVHLGEHPEVAVCIRCAHSLSKWAWELDDRSKSGPGVMARDAFRAARTAVVQRGWQDSPLLGGPIRWIGKWLP